jgi:transposase
MRNKKREMKSEVRYGEAFKMEVVREVERGGVTYTEVRRKYGIGGFSTVQRWVNKYGSGKVGKVIRVESPRERDEKAELKLRVRLLERALADEVTERALDRALLEIALERAGITDVEEFKKKVAGSR